MAPFCCTANVNWTKALDASVHLSLKARPPMDKHVFKKLSQDAKCCYNHTLSSFINSARSPGGRYSSPVKQAMCSELKLKEQKTRIKPDSETHTHTPYRPSDGHQNDWNLHLRTVPKL
eukprot:498665-Amphidinium_carterae.1